jgi:aspartate aminotransferase
MSNSIPALSSLLQPQERLDALLSAAFRQFGPRVMDLSYANPHDGPPAEVLAVLRRVAGECGARSLQYTPSGGRTSTRCAVAARLIREYSLPFHYRDVIMTTGAMSALNIAFRALFGRGDEVIVLTPAWQDYPLYLRNLEIPFRFVPLSPDKHLDIDAIGQAMGARTRGVLLSQPCCPTGVVYSRDEIVGLSRLLSDAESKFHTRIYLISDEVHRHMVWSGQPFFSPLGSYPRSLSIYSFGKALALQGQRIGYIAVSPRMAEHEKVRVACEQCVRLMGFGNPTSLMQHMVCDLVDYQPPLGELAGRQMLVREALSASGYAVCPGQAGFYVYVKSPVPDDFTFCERLASRGVLVVPSTLFHEPGYFRLSLTARLKAVTAALRIFDQILDDRIPSVREDEQSCSTSC